MSKQSEKVKQWRFNCKARIITAMGGGCCICGYNRCQSSLAIHHLDPKEKDFSLASIRANPKNWEDIVKELRKCVLICHNCHNEVHEGVSVVPADAIRFNEEYADYRKIENAYQEVLTPCPVCAKLKRDYLINCSLECAAKSRYRVDWDKVDLKKELESKTVIALAEELGCSDAAIHKRLKKLGLK